MREAHGEPATRELLAQARVIALGPVTAAAISALGVRVDQVAADTDDDAMLAAVLAGLPRT